MSTSKSQFNRRSTLLAAAAGLALSAFPSFVSAQTLSWANIAGGTASTSGNWSPAAVPGAANDLLWNLNNSYSVTFNSSTLTSRTHTYRQGSVTTTFSSPHTVTNGITIGDTNGLTAAMTLTTGTLNSTANVVIGSVSGSNGILNVNDDDADLIITAATSDMIVGSNGDAALSITGGGLVRVPDQFILGSNSSSSPNLTISGAQAISPFQRSSLVVLGTGTSSRFGAGGDATVNISNGALADFAGDLVVSNGSASISTVTLAGAGGLLNFNATLDVAGDLFLAQNTTAASAGGAATITLNDRGSLIVGGTLNLGNDPDGGSGTLNINAGATVQAANIIKGPSGTINHAGGTLQIDGGNYTGFTPPLVVSGLEVNDPTLSFANNSSQTLVPSGGVSLIVGDDLGIGNFVGSLLVESGADLNMGNGDLNIGDDQGVIGDVVVTGAGSRLIANSVNSDIRVGFGGRGSISAQNGGQCLFRNLLVPALGNGFGLADCHGADSNITTQFLSVGHTTGVGNGQVQIQLDGTLSITDPGLSTNVRASGILSVSTGGTITTPGTITADAGGIIVVGGTITNATLVDVSGTLNSLFGGGSPLVDAPVRLRSGALLNASIEDLTVGDSSSSTGFDAQDGSVITVDAHVLTLLDQNRATVDVVNLLNGGTIIAPSGLEIVTPQTNGTLDGTGTITTPELFMESGGSVITATGPNGITINGMFRNNSGNIDGTKYTFNANGPHSGWTGAGAINAAVVFNAGTEVNALANMAMGNNTPSGVTFNAGTQLNVDTRVVTLVDSNGLALPSSTTFGSTFGGGTIVCAQPLVLNVGRSLEGHGTIQTTAFSSSGNLRPREFPIDNNFAHIHMTGSLTLLANSDTFFEIYGDDVDTRPYDRISCTGAVSISGADAAIHVAFANGFVPVPGTLFVLLTGSTLSGVFPIHDIPARTKIDYGPNYAALLVLCPADFNEDGTVDFFDYLDFVDAFSDNLPTADFNRDSSIDFFDYLDFVDAFSAGC